MIDFIDIFVDNININIWIDSHIINDINIPFDDKISMMTIVVTIS